MSTASSIAESVRRILIRPSGGVVELVDELLVICFEHRLQLDWQGAHCRVRQATGEWEVIDAPLRKSIVRAILARITTLCNEQNSNAISPYGGEGQIEIDLQPGAMIRAAFTNTAADQKLEWSAPPR